MSDRSSSSGCARQLVQQAGSEVLQHHMLSATKTLQQEMKPKTERNRNVDEVVPLSLAAHPAHRPGKGKRGVIFSCSQHTFHLLRNEVIFILLSPRKNWSRKQSQEEPVAELGTKSSPAPLGSLSSHTHQDDIIYQELLPAVCKDRQ